MGVQEPPADDVIRPFEWVQNPLVGVKLVTVKLEPPDCKRCFLNDETRPIAGAEDDQQHACVEFPCERTGRIVVREDEVEQTLGDFIAAKLGA